MAGTRRRQRGGTRRYLKLEHRPVEQLVPRALEVRNGRRCCPRCASPVLWEGAMPARWVCIFCAWEAYP